MAFLLVLATSIFFYVSLEWISAFRASNTYLIFALPLLAVLLVFERRISRFRLSSREEVKSVTDLKRPTVSLYAGFLLVFQTLLVHLVGGSIGREGVGIQLGAWAARWAEAPRWYRAGCIATGISVIFGAPVTATAFIFETALVQKKSFDWKEILAVPLMAIGTDLLVRAIGLRHFSFPQFDFSSLQQLLNFKGLIGFAGFAVLIMVLSALFLLIASSVATKVKVLSDRNLFISAAMFLVVFFVGGFVLRRKSGFDWPWYSSVAVALQRR